MTLLLRPKGRGGWNILTLRLDGPRAAPLLVKRGDLIPIGGVVYRVVRVLA